MTARDLVASPELVGQLETDLGATAPDLRRMSLDDEIEMALLLVERLKEDPDAFGITRPERYGGKVLSMYRGSEPRKPLHFTG